MYLFQITITLCLYYYLFNKKIKSYYFIVNNNIKQKIKKMGNCFKLDKKVLVDDEIDKIVQDEKMNHFHKKMKLNKEICNFNSEFRNNFLKCEKLEKRINDLEQHNKELEMTVINTLKFQKIKSKTNEEVKQAYVNKIIESYVFPDKQT